MQNSTISGNRAFGGGGMYVYDSASALWIIQNSTIAFNHASDGGGGIFLFHADAMLESTIVANNSAAFSPDVRSFDENVDFFFVSFSLVRDRSGAFFANQGNNLDAGLDPLLAPLGNNGGPTLTHKLKKGSPAINKGSNPPGLTTDQRGAPFKRKIGPAVDIGAFERQ
jgi:hypothetical protein